MKKYYITLLAMALSGLGYCQVGINTPNPQATLDITGNPSDVSALDGIIVPRITGAQLKAKTYTSAQVGAMVYVTLADPAPAGQTANVTAVGLYAFDGTLWQAALAPILNAPTGTGTIIAINGQQQIAQEISAGMVADWALPDGGPYQVNYLTNEIIDNYNSFTSTLTGGNSFTVNTTGTYLATMNFPVQPASTTYSGNFFYGIYNDSDNAWVQQLLETLNLGAGSVANIAFNVAMNFTAGKIYSFRVRKNVNSPLSIRGQLSGAPSAFFSIKRLK